MSRPWISKCARCAPTVVPGLSHLIQVTGGRVNYISMAFTALAGILASVVRATRLHRFGQRLGSHHGVLELHAAFEQSPHGSLLVDAQTLRILSTNAALRRSLGLDEHELKALALP